MDAFRTGGKGMIACLAILAATGAASGGPVPADLCSLAIYEELVELEEGELDLSLARAEFAAYERIFKLTAELWKSKVIERMVYLESRYDRDAARLALEGAELAVERQRALIDRYRQACGSGDTGAGEEEGAGAASIPADYHEAHCRTLSKAAELAAVNLEFNRLLLENVLDLRAGQVATQVQVILAELEVERQEIRLEDARRRTEACRGGPPDASRPAAD